MNFFDVVVEGDGDDLRLHVAEGFALPVARGKAANLAPYKGKKLVLGVRPESIHDSAFCPPDIQASLVEAKVDVTEMMGNEVLAYLEVGQHKFLGRVDSRTAARPGQQIQVAFDIDGIHVFDADTNASIGLPAANVSGGSSST